MLEKLIRHLGRMLAEKQTAYLFKVPEEMTTTPCDFFGYTRYGRAILIECKEVQRASLPICDSPGLAPHQWNALCDAGRANCISLICWMRNNTLATIDIEMARELSRDRKSIPWDRIPVNFLHAAPTMMNCLSLLEPYISVRESSRIVRQGAGRAGT